MAKRNSQLTELLIVAQDDYLTIVDTSAGQSKRISVKNLTGAPDFGWQATGESHSFSSYSSTTKIGVVTVPTNATTKYSVGMKYRISQTTGGTKYGYIIAVTATTLSIFFGSFTLNNEAISTPVYSTLEAPYGFTMMPASYTSDGYLRFNGVLGKEAAVTSNNNNVIKQTGFDFITTPGGSGAITKVVTFPKTFTKLLSLQITLNGVRTGADPAQLSDLNNQFGPMLIAALLPSTSQFTAAISTPLGGAFGAGERWAFTYEATGIV